MTTPARPPRNVTSVGGLVVVDDHLLVVRMTYGPTRGRYMIPGGLLEPGETLDLAAAREVREETGIEARPLGIVGVRSRYDGPNTDTYIVWLLEYLAGSPEPDGREIDDTRFMPFDEIAARDDVAALVKYLAGHVASNGARIHQLVTDYDNPMAGATPDSWKLFL